MKNLTTTTWAACSQNPTAFVPKLFNGKSNFQSSLRFLIKLNASHRKFDGIHIILVLWKTDYTNPKQAVDGYLKKKTVLKINKLPYQSTSHTVIKVWIETTRLTFKTCKQQRNFHLHRQCWQNEVNDPHPMRIWFVYIDTWPAATRVLSRGRERTLGTRLHGYHFVSTLFKNPFRVAYISNVAFQRGSSCRSSSRPFLQNEDTLILRQLVSK